MKVEFQVGNAAESRLLLEPMENWPANPGFGAQRKVIPGKITSEWFYQEGGKTLRMDISQLAESDSESLRKAGAKLLQELKAAQVSRFGLPATSSEIILPLIEGVLLASYEFNNRKSKPETSTLVIELAADIAGLDQLVQDCQAVANVRDLVNEPFSHMGVAEFCAKAHKVFPGIGVNVEVLEKKQLEALKLGGILGVNKGSVDPPALLVLDYNPQSTSAPIVLVGKGVVYDTGGLSLKPTPNSMDMMKCDMAGGAAVFGALQLVAQQQLKTRVIGLIPLTDNRPGGAAIAPGDVLTMGNGQTVEVMNTDAEGRLILADALHYAHRYKPQLVIDMATLTGSAVAAIGQYGAVAMGTAQDQVMQNLIQAGNETGDRIVPFPFWEEYGEELKSEVADIKNLGSSYAGSITAGKFLEHFTKTGDDQYPWIHIDIAGPAFIPKPMGYWTTGGTGFGARLMLQYIKNNHG